VDRSGGAVNFSAPNPMTVFNQIGVSGAVVREKYTPSGSLSGNSITIEARVGAAKYFTQLNALNAIATALVNDMNAFIANNPNDPQVNADAVRYTQIKAQWDRLGEENGVNVDATVVQSVDQMLAEEESNLRRQLEVCETLRQKAG